MGPNRRALTLCIFLVVALLSPGPTAAAAEDGGHAEGVPVTISGPPEVVLEGGEGTEFQLHVSSRIDCRSGLEPPRDLIMFPAQPASDRGEGRLWRITPDSVRIAWEPAPDKKDAYILDHWVTFNVTNRDTPAAPVEAEALMLLEELKETDTRLHCRVDGYDLDLEEHELSFLVVPHQDPASAMADAPEEPPVRWFPMLLAVGILAALAAFATVRERQRRRG